MPPCLNEAKKPGPTCRPIEKTKRINPNSCTKWRTSPSTVMPKWLKRMPTKSIHVMPSETPPILTFPRRMPTVITSAKISTAWAMPLPKKSE